MNPAVFGQTTTHYRILQVVGRGSMGMMYKL
jgi:hypothetical protein